MQNFEDVIERDCYYVDKTPFIEDIEDSNMYFFFIRPRRFGKSLTISMLENYYDINKKDKFDEISPTRFSHTRSMSRDTAHRPMAKDI